MSTQLPETPSERRRAQQRADARRVILEATEALLLEAGYEAFSMRRLAERCGYTAPTIYHHFGDKNGLIDALLEERFRQMVAVIREVPEQSDPAETLRDMFHAYARFGLENPTFYRLLAMARPNHEEPPASAEQARALIEGPMTALARSGRLATRDIELAMQTVWVMLHGLVSLRISRPGYEWREGLDEFARDTILGGLVRPASGEATP